MRTKGKGRLLSKLENCLDNIFKFSEEIMHFTPTWQQEELFNLVQYETFSPVDKIKKGIAVTSGQGPGKTSAVSIVSLFRLCQRPKSFILVTAPTRRQVESIYITEMGRRVERAEEGFSDLIDIQKTRVRMLNVDGWEIVTATSNKPENVQGYHEPGMTVIVEEASGIKRAIWATLKGTITQPENLLLAIGNPNRRNSEFFDMFNKDAELYHLLQWNAEESPNVDKKHIEKMAKEYGKDSDIYRVRVLGQFPSEDPNVVIRYEDLLYACRQKSFNAALRTLSPFETANRRQIGIDLARFGRDESVICVRFNCAVVRLVFFSKKEPIDVIRHAFSLQKELGWRDEETIYCVDAGGMGQGVMVEFRDNNKIWHEFHFGGTAVEPRKYKDSVTEAYFVLRKLTRERQVSIKEDHVSFYQLTDRQYKFHEGLFRLEDKDEYLTRVEDEEDSFSPDRADAIALAFYPYTCSDVNIPQ